MAEGFYCQVWSLFPRGIAINNKVYMETLAPTLHSSVVSVAGVQISVLNLYM